MNIQKILDRSITETLVTLGAPADAKAVVKPSVKPIFGHYQANGIMALAKKMGKNPRELAQLVVDTLNLNPIVEHIEIAGPGFINLFLSPTWLAQEVQAIIQSPRLGIEQAIDSQTVVVDYSAPNIAKEMHVGHIRSNCIGDAVVRHLEFLGHKVIRANHIGDWGTQFGMLIAHLETVLATDFDQQNQAPSEMEAFYRDAKSRFDTDADFAQRARQYVVKLQQKDPECLSLWQRLVELTMTQNQLAYDRMNISLKPWHVMGESQYNDALPMIVQRLREQGLAIENEGAWVVYLKEFINKAKEPLGVIVQKQDGGYLYTTTDLAAVQYRVNVLKATRILYFTDVRQAQHMQQVYKICRLSGIAPKAVSLEHHPFGMVLGKDNKPFKTRTGDTVKLMAVLDEAQERALSLIQQRTSEISLEEQKNIAHVLSIAAIKYFELSKHRLTDYVFDWDAMLSFEGNTAPYLLYAYTRICSIFRKTGLALHEQNQPINLNHPIEMQLALHLCRFSEVLEAVAEEALPHLLCHYLYELSAFFMNFYEHCPIYKEDIVEEEKQSRLMLAVGTAKTLKQGMELLGIGVLERM